MGIQHKRRNQKVTSADASKTEVQPAVAPQDDAGEIGAQYGNAAMQESMRITHLTGSAPASSVLDSYTEGAGHLTAVLPSPSRVYG